MRFRNDPAPETPGQAPVVLPLRLADDATRDRVRGWLSRVATRAETRRALDRLRATNGVDDVVTLLLASGEVQRALDPERVVGAAFTPPWERHVVGGLVVDPASGEASLRGRALALEPIERALLEHLVAHRDRVVGREELLRCVWGGGRFRSRVVDAYVGRLRAKLQDGDVAITTVRGAGYRLVPDGAGTGHG